ncbi:MAG TPA: tetratricopeptide repeat protein [Holophagaceae bacterium]
MVTKAKSTAAPKTAAPAAAPPSPHADTLAKGVKLVDSGKHAEAVPVLEALVREAQASGDWAMKRRAQVYLSLAQDRLAPAKAATADPVTEVQAHLNRRDSEAALKLLDKLLKEHSSKALFHYLRAVALAQREQAEDAAESLKKALDLDPDLLYLWHMEPDFAAMRKSPLFAFTEGR